MGVQALVDRVRDVSLPWIGVASCREGCHTRTAGSTSTRLLAIICPGFPSDRSPLSKINDRHLTVYLHRPRVALMHAYRPICLHVYPLHLMPSHELGRLPLDDAQHGGRRSSRVL
jgi:hypothetical protein